MSLHYDSWPPLQVPSSRNPIGASLETCRQHLNGSLQTLACNAALKWSGNQCPLCCWLEYRRTYFSIFLKLVELPLKLLGLKEMWKIAINFSACLSFLHSLHSFTSQFVPDIEALSGVNTNNSWHNDLPPPWPRVRIPWGSWNPYTQATLSTGEVRVQASVFFRLPEDSSVQPILKTSVLSWTSLLFRVKCKSTFLQY